LDFTQLIVLAALQAAAAIFAVAPDGHLLLISTLLHWDDPASGFRLACEIGLLLGVMAFFWRDIGEMVSGVARAAKGKRDPGARLAAQMVTAAIPVLSIGFAIQHYLADDWQAEKLMGWAIVAVALLLLLFDRMSMTVKRVEHATFVDTIVIGLCQLALLVPGAGAAGVAITMGRLLGYERAAAARLFFLLSIPVSFAVLGRDAYSFMTQGAASTTRNDIVAGGVSFITALIGLSILMAWLRRSTYTPIVVYRLILGGMVLALAYGWVAF
jgi:undecaprenyl-diphosphatase